MIFTAPFLPAWHSTMSAPPPWPATPPTCVERHCHETAAARLSDDHEDGVAATCQRVDAISTKLKFGKRKKRTLSQHEVPVPNSTSLRRRVLHAPREVVDALEDDDVPADRRVRKRTSTTAPARDARRRPPTSPSKDAAAAATAELRPRAALPPASRSRRESAQCGFARIAGRAAF